MNAIKNDATLIPARMGRAARISAGQILKVINTHGSQVVDTWAFNADDVSEYMSMEHTRTAILKIGLRVGDTLVSNRRNPMLTLLKDTGPGNHDMLIAACDVYRYEQLGAHGHHENCTDNLHEALESAGLQMDRVPSPLNLFMNFLLRKQAASSWPIP